MFFDSSLFITEFLRTLLVHLNQGRKSQLQLGQELNKLNQIIGQCARIWNIFINFTGFCTFKTQIDHKYGGHCGYDGGQDQNDSFQD